MGTGWWWASSPLFPPYLGLLCAALHLLNCFLDCINKKTSLTLVNISCVHWSKKYPCTHHISENSPLFHASPHCQSLSSRSQRAFSHHRGLQCMITLPGVQSVWPWGLNGEPQAPVHAYMHFILLNWCWHKTSTLTVFDLIFGFLVKKNTLLTLYCTSKQSRALSHLALTIPFRLKKKKYRTLEKAANQWLNELKMTISPFCWLAYISIIV